MIRQRLYIALFFLLAMRVLQAQTCVQVSNAVKALQGKDLEGALQQIELALGDTSCTSDAATWYYSAFIYKDYYRQKESAGKNAPSRNKAIEAARKNLAMDPKNRYAEECKKIINILSVSYYNDAAKDLNEEQYASAFDNYLHYLENVKYSSSPKTDTSAIFYAGYSAYMSKNYPKAKEFLRKAIDLNYKDPNAYYYLSKTHRAMGEKDESFKILNEGQKRFPENKELILSSVNDYLKEGKLKELEISLDKAIKLDPPNINLKLNAAKVSELLSESEHNESAKYFTKAEKFYKEVIKTDSNNFIANYNLALMHYNKAVNIIDKLDPDTGIPNLDKIQDQTVAIFKSSLPYMQKAYILNPTKKEVLEGLAGIYFALNETTKFKEFKLRVDEMNK